ncbi:MAG: hypothetical protein DRH33_04225 [Candidatus Nealsonbacteria bacterium]|nr:MAG: hypothetical protein DRH33_04225 [Candidatus Nealsonbacteria bacterium]
MALEFNGTEECYVLCGNSIDLTGLFTVYVKFIISALTGTSQSIIAKREQGTYYTQFTLEINTDDHIRGAARTSDDTGYVSCVSTDTLSVGVIYSAVLTKDANNLHLYVDSVEKDSQPKTTGQPTNPAQVGIGGTPRANETYTTVPFNGTVIEARIFDGKALSPTEVKILHYSQGADNIVDGLVGRWLMNEKPDGQTASGANSVIDISGKGNHGTPYNSPIYRGAPVKLVKPIFST